MYIVTGKLKVVSVRQVSMQYNLHSALQLQMHTQAYYLHGANLSWKAAACIKITYWVSKASRRVVADLSKLGRVNSAWHKPPWSTCMDVFLRDTCLASNESPVFCRLQQAREAQRRMAQTTLEQSEPVLARLSDQTFLDAALQTSLDATQTHGEPQMADHKIPQASSILLQMNDGANCLTGRMRCFICVYSVL